MRTGRVLLAATLGLFVTSSAQAQQTPQENTVSEVHRVTPKPGMRAQSEAGRAKHMAWHKQQGDTFAWHVWEVVTGPNTGSYIIVSPGHQWKDFDGWNAKMAKGDAADAEVNLTPHQASSTMSYWTMLADASRPGPGPAMPKMGTLTTFRVKAGKVDQFRQSLRTIKDGLDKANWPLRAIWYSLANGGPIRSYAVFGARESLADMAPRQPTMREAVEKAIGRGQTDAAFDAFNDAVEEGESEMLEFRPDLSHIPGTPAS